MKDGKWEVHHFGYDNTFMLANPNYGVPLDVCRELKNDPKTTHIPIVMLTVKGEESDIVIGLELGADDYITKPFSPKVLLARLKAVLRRRKTEPVAETDYNI